MLKTSVCLSAFVAALVSLSNLSIARAEESVKIMSGGPTGAEALQKIKDKIKAETGAEIETPINPSDVGFAAVVRGVVDMASGQFDDMLASAERQGLPKQNANDFLTLESSKTNVIIGVHPENPVKEFSKEQMTDILTGKLKNWQSINGENMPIKVFFGRAYVGVLNNVNKVYLDGKISPVAKMVTDKKGIYRAIKADKGAVGLFTGKDKLENFEPKFLKSDVNFRNSIVMKKDARPIAKKVFDYLKAHPEFYQ